MSEIIDKSSEKDKLTKSFLAISAATAVVFSILTLAAILIKGPFKEFWMQAIPWVISGLALALFMAFLRICQKDYKK